MPMINGSGKSSQPKKKEPKTTKKKSTKSTKNIQCELEKHPVCEEVTKRCEKAMTKDQYRKFASYCRGMAIEHNEFDKEMRFMYEYIQYQINFGYIQ